MNEDRRIEAEVNILIASLPFTRPLVTDDIQNFRAYVYWKRQKVFCKSQRPNVEERLRNLARAAYVKISPHYWMLKPEMAQHFLRRAEKFMRLSLLVRLQTIAEIKAQDNQQRPERARHFEARAIKFARLLSSCVPLNTANPSDVIQ